MDFSTTHFGDFAITITSGIQDTTPPTITLLGNTVLHINQNTTYTDAGATASDNVDGNISSSIITNNTVNTAVLGTYVITYDVSDYAGNDAVQVRRTVYVDAVVVQDTTAPVITLSGNSTITINQGASYTDAGATASDNLDGNISANIVTSGSVDTSTTGTYTITYTVSDAAGNSATPVTRTVQVTAATNGGGSNGG